jgi:D-sedoheptulose 7-phosphate isomerase
VARSRHKRLFVVSPAPILSARQDGNNMRDLSSILQHAIGESIETLQALGELDQQMRRATDAVAQCLIGGHKILICGNGGSAADASHFATEFVIRFINDRPAYPAICLTADGGLLSAAGNDYGFEEVFARQVAAFGQPGDVLICLTTSGKSRNVQRAVEEAKQRGVTTITLLGRGGGPMINTSDIELVVRGEATARIQEAHMLLLHVLCEAVEERVAAH